MFEALLLRQTDGGISAAVESLDEDDLPEGDVLVSILYSSLNYKDALAVTGRGKIIRGAYPFVPGIDFVGTVVESASREFQPGQLVLATGWGLGENHWGGYSQLQRVSGAWLVHLPSRMDPLMAMAVGTAGLTAMLSVVTLQEHSVHAEMGEVVVTGASGGVGSLSVLLLSKLGYKVVASTGSGDAHDYLRSLGASSIIDRAELAAGPARPMESARWAGAVDTVGGKSLASILASMQRHGSVASCGLAEDHELHTTVFPFILRGVNLLGIDSNTCPPHRRRAAWERLADLVTQDDVRRISRTIPLADVPRESEALLDNRIRGRIVVDVGSEGSSQ
ncbi:MAG TPA: MDR family oxidoreductase [Rhodothermales bacterium]